MCVGGPRRLLATQVPRASHPNESRSCKAVRLCMYASSSAGCSAGEQAVRPEEEEDQIAGGDDNEGTDQST